MKIIPNYAFYECSNITTVNMSYSIRIISKQSFYHCDSLIEVNFIEQNSISLTSETEQNQEMYFGEYAFAYCTSLKSIIIPDHIQTILDCCFAYCYSLTYVQFTVNCAQGIALDAFLATYILENVVVTGDIDTLDVKFDTLFYTTRKINFTGNINSIGPNLFPNRAEEIILPKSLINISDEAFSYCNIKEITIPSTVTSFNTKLMFYECQALEFVNIECFIDKLHNRMFIYCKNLTTIKLSHPEKIKYIGKECFSNCPKLQSINLEEFTSLETISPYAFWKCSSLIEIIMTNSVTYWEGIDEWDSGCQFGYCISLKKVKLSNNIKIIPRSAFSNCYSLEEINIPPSVETIESRAFYNCYNLKTINQLISTDELRKKLEISSLKEIQSYAFYNCTNLKLFEFPEGLKTIGSYSFTNCSSISSVEIPSTVKYIYSNAFCNCTSLTSIVIEGNVDEIGKNAFGNCTNLNEFIYNGDNKPDISAEAFSGCGTIENISVPNNFDMSVFPNYVTISPNDNENQNGTSLSGGAIAGIVIGSCAFVGICAFCVYFFIIRKRSSLKIEGTSSDSSLD